MKIKNEEEPIDFMGLELKKSNSDEAVILVPTQMNHINYQYDEVIIISNNKFVADTISKIVATNRLNMEMKKAG